MCTVEKLPVQLITALSQENECHNVKQEKVVTTGASMDGAKVHNVATELVSSTRLLSTKKKIVIRKVGTERKSADVPATVAQLQRTVFSMARPTLQVTKPRKNKIIVTPVTSVTTATSADSCVPPSVLLFHPPGAAGNKSSTNATSSAKTLGGGITAASIPTCPTASSHPNGTHIKGAPLRIPPLRILSTVTVKPKDVEGQKLCQVGISPGNVLCQPRLTSKRVRKDATFQIERPSAVCMGQTGTQGLQQMQFRNKETEPDRPKRKRVANKKYSKDFFEINLGSLEYVGSPKLVSSPGSLPPHVRQTAAVLGNVPNSTSKVCDVNNNQLVQRTKQRLVNKKYTDGFCTTKMAAKRAKSSHLENVSDLKSMAVASANSSPEGYKEAIKKLTVLDSTKFEIIKGVSVRGGDKLYDNDGYDYTQFKDLSRGGRRWRCSIRNKLIHCHATLLEDEKGVFRRGLYTHNHAPNPSARIFAILRAETRKRALSEPTKSAEVIADEVMAPHLSELTESGKSTLVLRGHLTCCVHFRRKHSGIPTAPQEREAMQRTTCQIISGTTTRGGPKLFTDEGYVYTCKVTYATGPKLWGCCIRPKKNYCRATITQSKEDLFEFGPHPHNHEPTPDAKVFSLITTEAKIAISQNRLISVSHILQEKLQKYEMEEISQQTRRNLHQNLLNFCKRLDSGTEDEPEPITTLVVTVLGVMAVESAASPYPTIPSYPSVETEVCQNSGTGSERRSLPHCPSSPSYPDVGTEVRQGPRAGSERLRRGKTNGDIFLPLTSIAAHVVVPDAPSAEIVVPSCPDVSSYPTDATQVEETSQLGSSQRESMGVNFELDLIFMPFGFLKKDISTPSSRHIVFSTEEQLRWLQKADVWYIHTSNKVVKKPFQQLLSIHAFFEHEGNVKQLPLVFCFLSRKHKSDYASVLREILKLLPETSSVERIIANFDKHLWKGCRHTLPGVEVKGCAYHFKEAVLKHIKDLRLEKKLRKNDTDSDIMKKLMALCFLPPGQVRRMFHKLQKSLPPSSGSMKCLFAIVKKRWIKNRMWHPVAWSVYNNPFRTRDEVEGWIEQLSGDKIPESHDFYPLIQVLYDFSVEIFTDDDEIKPVSDKKLRKFQRKIPDSLQRRVFKHWDRYTEGDCTARKLLHACSKEFDIDD